MVTLHDGKPVVKVIDFGVSKAINQQLTEKTLFTNYGQMIGTPQYMSPEQATLSAVDVDTRADIYSLGALLYDLLTGSTLFEQSELKEAGDEAALRIIRKREPAKPSTKIASMDAALATNVSSDRRTDQGTLRKLVSGDLDWIVMKAIDKDRVRRYSSATVFAEDLQRCLVDEPVTARPPSTSYQFRKFVRRNKTLMGSIAAIALTLVFALVVTTWGLVLYQGQVQRSIQLAKDADLAASQFSASGSFQT